MNRKSYLLLMSPGLVLLLFFLVAPIIKILTTTVITPQGLSLSNYTKFFRDSYYMAIFVRTLKIAIVTTLFCALLGIPTAYFISLCGAQKKKILLSVSVFPLLTNSVIRSFAWINILGKNGVVNSLLLQLHLIKSPLNLLYTDFSITMGLIYLFLPLMIISLVGVMDNIDPSFMEAAESMGANRVRAFMKVIFPLSLSGIIVGSVLVFTGSLTAYTTPQLLGGNKHLVMSTFIYQKAMTIGDWTGASVIATVMIITTIIVIKLLNMLATKLDRREKDGN